MKTLESIIAASLFATRFRNTDALDVTTDTTGFLDDVMRLDSDGGISHNNNNNNNNSIINSHGIPFTRIAGGNVALKNRYPYYTALFRQTDESGTDYLKFTCGGSLIRDDVVITAGTSTNHSKHFLEVHIILASTLYPTSLCLSLSLESPLCHSRYRFCQKGCRQLHDF